MNDVVRVNVAEGREQPPHVALDLGRCHQVQEILPEREREREGGREFSREVISNSRLKRILGIDASVI